MHPAFVDRTACGTLHSAGYILDELGSTQLLGFFTFAIAGGDGNDFVAVQGMSPLNAQVSEATNADYANGLAGSSTEALKRSIGGYTSAQERSGYNGIKKGVRISTVSERQSGYVEWHTRNG